MDGFMLVVDWCGDWCGDWGGGVDVWAHLLSDHVHMHRWIGSEIWTSFNWARFGLAIVGLIALAVLAIRWVRV